MPSYLPVADHASPVAAGLPAGMVAIRAADLQIRSGGGRGAVLAGAAVAAGTMVTFCRPLSSWCPGCTVGSTW